MIILSSTHNMEMKSKNKTNSSCELHNHATDFSPSSGDSSCVIQLLSAEQGRPSFCQQNVISHKTSTWMQHIHMKFMFSLKSAGFLINTTKLSIDNQDLLSCYRKKIPSHCARTNLTFLFHQKFKKSMC